MRGWHGWHHPGRLAGLVTAIVPVGPALVHSMLMRGGRVVVRRVICSQVGFALIGLVATLADQGTVPRSLFPPQLILMLCALSAFALPVAVLGMGWLRTPGSGQVREAIVSIGLAVATMFALLPLVQ